MAQRNNSFRTDSNISKFNCRRPIREKVLHSWKPTYMDGDDMRKYDLGSGNNNNVGWDANDMFKRNEQVYGVTSTFDDTLRGYTTEIKTDASDFKELEAKAIRLAREIQKNSISQRRAELENCDEEEIFPAVSRKRNRLAHNQDKKNVSISQKPESQRYYNSPRDMQRNNYNQYKYPKNASNERRDYGSGPGNKHSNRNRRLHNLSDNILNESVTSYPKVEILKKCVPEQKPSVSIGVDDENDLKKCSTNFNLTEIKIQNDAQVTSLSSVLDEATQHQDNLVVQQSCSFPLQKDQEVTEQIDEALQLVNDGFEDGEKENILLITKQNEDIEEYSTDLNATEIESENGTQVSSSVVTETYQDDVVESESSCYFSREIQEINEQKEDESLQIDPEIISPSMVMAEVTTRQPNQQPIFDSLSPDEQRKELSEPVDESRTEFPAQILNECRDEKKENVEKPNESSIPFKLNPYSKEFQPRTDDPPETCQVPLHHTTLYNTVMPVLVPVPIYNHFQNYSQHIIIPLHPVHYSIYPGQLYVNPQFIIGFQQPPPPIIPVVSTVLFTMV